VEERVAILLSSIPCLENCEGCFSHICLLHTVAIWTIKNAQDNNVLGGF
jgi:hypothetical protein